MVLHLGRNAWLDLLGEGVTILIDKNKYNGTIETKTDNNIFTITAILYVE